MIYIYIFYKKLIYNKKFIKIIFIDVLKNILRQKLINF